MKLLMSFIIATTVGMWGIIGWNVYHLKQKPEAIRVPYGIVEMQPTRYIELADASQSMTPVTILGVLSPDDNWATAFGVFDTMADCQAELGDIAWQYREKWPMAVMWCAINGGEVAMVRPKPRPETFAQN